MTILLIVSSLFLLCLIITVIHARAIQADTPTEAAAITRQHVDHKEGIWADDNPQAQLRASVHTTSGSRRLGEKLAAAQAHRLDVLPAPRSDSG
jgi:hypothetical protein